MRLVRSLVLLSTALAANIAIVCWLRCNLLWWGTFGHRTRSYLLPGLGWLGLIRSKETILERGAVKASDDGVHLFRIGCVDKGEALRFLRFGIPNHFDVVKDQALGIQPGLDVVLRYPNR